MTRPVLNAVANVNDLIAPTLVGLDPARQAEINQLLLQLDGSPNKAKLGANAILGVSMAVARAAAQASRLGQGRKSSDELITLYQHWLKTFPIVSIEDGLDENDWQGFAKFTAAEGGRTQIVGDDIFVTNPAFIRRGIAEKTANAVLIKLNQIGTVSETVQAIALCREAGWGYVISHRSGETEDTFMADFAVAMGGGQIKTGS